ncbi:RtcB family protein [Asaia astilbis]|uniref:RNA-splicing ligase RtcB n=1 Tax=Asaia astilbis TaxID=610244 RepID=UPI00046F7E35|nr:RNA-splicing ligase RtcB [Asaia astilbis]
MDTRTAYAWGIKPGTIGIMIHYGSLFAGGMAGDHYVDLARKLYPTNLERPKHDFYPLPLNGQHAHHARAYMNALGLASNFGVINRMCMQYMALGVLKDILGQDFNSHLVYDLSHNMLFENEGDYLHRKGSSPAGNTDFFPDGHPVIVPGSMGSSSFIMKGGSLSEALNSAPHGAGRLLSRGKARVRAQAETLRVVSRVAPVGLRADIKRELDKELMEESPDSYKPVLPAFNTVQNSGMASGVAEMKPILTVKG